MPIYARWPWAEDHVAITTIPRDSQVEPSSAKRFGVFFGVSKYEFNDVVKEVTGGKSSPNLPSSTANDARAFALLMRDLGKLDAVQVCVDEKATKSQMEAAITGWLPSVSKPGDTVFIFFSGHGSQIPDNNGDEADNLDEWLLPHDYVDAAVLAGLLKRKKEGRLDPRLEPRLAAWMEIARRSGAVEKANENLVRVTGVTDDLLGHWLQRLSGRRVVVIVDACRSGGMATNEKSLKEDPLLRFDFLDGEVARLKDIGQPDSALLAACGVRQNASALRIPDGMLAKLREGTKGTVDEWATDAALSVMTYYCIEGLLSGERPMNLQNIYNHCQAGMEEYFHTVNEIQNRQGKKQVTPHQPILVKYSSVPIIVKP